MYLQAVELVENEGKAATAGETYRSAISEAPLSLLSACRPKSLRLCILNDNLQGSEAAPTNLI